MLLISFLNNVAKFYEKSIIYIPFQSTNFEPFLKNIFFNIVLFAQVFCEFIFNSSRCTMTKSYEAFNLLFVFHSQKVHCYFGFVALCLNNVENIPLINRIQFEVYNLSREYPLSCSLCSHFL